jgi:transcriptional regulator with XRE-family HTH domain
MNENERFTDALNYLILNKKVRNQQEFTERVGSNKTTISQIKNGETKIPNNLFEKITQAFPIISFDWLKKGEGEMLKSNNQENNVSKNEGIVGIQGNGNNITNNDISAIKELVSPIVSLIEKNDEQIANVISILKAKDDQINRLIGIIENYGR